jgi:hypothetical protein
MILDVWWCINVRLVTRLYNTYLRLLVAGGRCKVLNMFKTLSATDFTHAITQNFDNQLYGVPTTSPRFQMKFDGILVVTRFLARCDWNFIWPSTLLRPILILKSPIYDFDDQSYTFSTTHPRLLNNQSYVGCKQVASWCDWGFTTDWQSSGWLHKQYQSQKGFWSYSKLYTDLLRLNIADRSCIIVSLVVH